MVELDRFRERHVGAHLHRDLGMFQDREMAQRHLARNLHGAGLEIRGRHRKLEIVLLPPVGEVPVLLDAFAGWLVNAAPR